MAVGFNSLMFEWNKVKFNTRFQVQSYRYDEVTVTHT
jgi:hypothetical protein